MATRPTRLTRPGTTDPTALSQRLARARQQGRAGLSAVPTADPTDNEPTTTPPPIERDPDPDQPVNPDQPIHLDSPADLESPTELPVPAAPATRPEAPSDQSLPESGDAVDAPPFTPVLLRALDPGTDRPAIDPAIPLSPTPQPEPQLRPVGIIGKQSVQPGEQEDSARPPETGSDLGGGQAGTVETTPVPASRTESGDGAVVDHRGGGVVSEAVPVKRRTSRRAAPAATVTPMAHDVVLVRYTASFAAALMPLLHSWLRHEWATNRRRATRSEFLEAAFTDLPTDLDQLRALVATVPPTLLDGGLTQQAVRLHPDTVERLFDVALEVKLSPAPRLLLWHVQSAALHHLGTALNLPDVAT